MACAELLVLAAYETIRGLCIAGMIGEQDPVTGLRWIRVDCESWTSSTTSLAHRKGPHLRPFSVIALNLLAPSPQAPCIERWTVSDSEDSVQVLRHLAGTPRTHFLNTWTDRAPHEVLDNQQRSLCLIRPTWIHGSFRLDPHSGHFDARMAFGLGRRTYRGPFARGGFPVIAPGWNEFGRSCLPPTGGWTEFDASDLETRFGVEQIFLTIGLTRSSTGRFEPTVLAVHCVPEFRPARSD